MSHFHLNLDDMKDGTNLNDMIRANQQNFTPTGQAKALSTTETKSPDPKVSLTSFTVSDVMQNVPLMKPLGYSYDSFNNIISDDLATVRNSSFLGQKVNIGPTRNFLAAYDTRTGKSIDFGAGFQVAGQASAGASQQPSSPGGAVTAGDAPPDIPRGPFPVRLVRTSNTNSVKSDVEPVTLTGDQILRLLLSIECPLEGATFLWALAKRESSFVANVAGINNNGTMDVGLWQLNEVNWKSRGYTAEQATDPWTNVSITMEISNNGTRFVPWQTSGNYSSPDGSHLKGVNMEESRNFFREAGYQV